MLLYKIGIFLILVRTFDADKHDGPTSTVDPTENTTPSGSTDRTTVSGDTEASTFAANTEAVTVDENSEATTDAVENDYDYEEDTCDRHAALTVLLKQLDAYVKDHDPRIPVITSVATKTSNIELHFQISGLPAVNDHANQISVTGMMMMSIDTELTWEPDDYCGISELSDGQVDPKKVWQPVIYSTSLLSYQSSLPGGDHAIASTSSTGQMFIFPFGKATFNFICHFHPQYYPFDTQLCEVVFYASGQDGLVLNMIDTKCYFVDFTKINQAWDIISCSSSLEKPDGQYAAPRIFVLLQRRTAIPSLTIVAPTFLLALTNPVIFLLPAHETEKSSTGLTFLLTFFVFLQTMKETVPESTAVPFFSIFLMITLTLNCSAIGLSAILITMEDQERAKKTQPNIIRRHAGHRGSRNSGLLDHPSHITPTGLQQKHHGIPIYTIQ